MARDNMTNYRIIDMHHHFIPDVYRDALMELGVDKAGGRGIKKWSPEDSLAMMDKYQIETAIGTISAPALNPVMKVAPEKAIELARKTNEALADMVKKYPKRFGAYALLPMPDVEASLEEIRYALDVLKLDGIGLLSNYEGQFLGDEVFAPIFEELQKRKAVVYLHPGEPPATLPRPQFIVADYFQEFTFNTCRAAANLIFSGTMERCPDIKIVLSHAGGVFPFLRFRFNQCFLYARKGGYLTMSDTVKAAYDSLIKDPVEYMSMFYYDLALTTQKTTFDALRTTTTLDHVFYGSDAHFASDVYNEVFLKNIVEYYSNEELEVIFRRGPEKLFPRFRDDIATKNSELL